MAFELLRPLEQLGEGGQGRVWSTPAVRINGTWAVAYKEYSPVTAAQVDWSVLEQMVRLTPSLPYEDGRELAERSAWPVAIVEKGGHPAGFLMRLVPPDFSMSLRFPGGTRRVAASLQFLLNPIAYLQARGLEVSDGFRLRLLEQVALTLQLLHRHGIAVGDLSPNNIYFNPNSAACFFLDCDGMSLRGRSPLAPVETPEWQVPAGEPLATPESDGYKFGLLVVRLFAGDQMTRDPASLPSGLGQLKELAERALDMDPSVRPGMEEWLTVLRTGRALHARSAVVVPATVAPPLSGADTVRRKVEISAALPRRQYRPQALAWLLLLLLVLLGLFLISF